MLWSLPMGERRAVTSGLFISLIALALLQPTSAWAQEGENPFVEDEDPFATETGEGDPAESPDDPNETGEQSGEALPPPTVPEGYGGGEPAEGAQPAQGGAQPAPNTSGQPGYGQSQPGYAQPGYGQQPYAQQRPPRLQRIPYREGMSIPEGGRLIEKRSLGLIITGGAMFLVSYGLAASLYVDSDFTGAMLVPVVGPIIETREDDLLALGRMFLVFDGLLQGAGLTLFALGLGRKKKYIEYYGSNEPGWRVSPRFGFGGGGIDLRARF